MKPKWLKRKIPSGANYRYLSQLFSDLKLNTVCEEARCPNLGECWDRKMATLMIMGEICTRSCGFCAVTTGKPLPLDADEPSRVAHALSKLGLTHVVITSVDRDDLSDGGAGHYAETVLKIKQYCPSTSVEVLIPDFKGVEQDLEKIFTARPHILAHNLETVSSLQKKVRPQAHYERSLEVLNLAVGAGLVAKSGFMVGLGERPEEIRQTFLDLKNHGRVSIVTVGQYLQPGPKNLPVEKFYSPREFQEMRDVGLALGLKEVASGPFVRSSYQADQSAKRIRITA